MRRTAARRAGRRNAESQMLNEWVKISTRSSRRDQAEDTEKSSLDSVPLDVLCDPNSE